MLSIDEVKEVYTGNFLDELWDLYKENHINHETAEKILRSAYRFRPAEPILLDRYFITDNDSILKEAADKIGLDDLNFIYDIKSGLFLIDLGCFHEETMARIFAATKNKTGWLYKHSEDYIEKCFGVYKSSCSKFVTISRDLPIPKCLKFIHKSNFETIQERDW